MNQMKGMMHDHEGLPLLLMKMLGKKLLEMEIRLESMVFKNSRTCIVEFLKDLVEEKGVRVGYEMLVRPFLNHRDIANITATSRQTATTVLNDFRRKNILIFDRSRLLVRDTKALAHEAYICQTTY